MHSIGTTALNRTALFLTVLALLVVVADENPSGRPDRGPVTPRTSAVYGSGIAADGLANTQVGGTSCGCPNLRSSYRFRAGRSAPLTAIRIYLVTDTPGYSGGSGGTINVTIREDDGSPLHAPSERILASADVPLDTFPYIEFDQPATLAGGRLYHVVFMNRDPDPTVNFVSINSLFVESPTTPRQAQFPDIDWAQLMNYGDGWVVRPQYTPILQLEYADRSVEGMGYMESWIAAAKAISGVARVRESFVVSGGDVKVSSISIRIARRDGSDALSVRLETAQGQLVHSGPIRASSVPLAPDGIEGGSVWVTVELPEPALLHNYHAYSLVLSSGSDATYVAHGIRKGEAYGFEPPTYFADGVAEFDDGTGWAAFDPGWRGPLAEADLQFYLR